VTAARRPPGARLLALYPSDWRARYEAEVAWILEHEPPSLRGRLDLVRGAIDAHLHPLAPSPLPVGAAIAAAGLLSAHAIVVSLQPVPPDWPGYLEETLPLIGLGVVALVPALVGLWLKLGDADGLLGRLGIVVALGGHVAWLTALAAAALRLEYGAITAVASSVAMAGAALLGVALAGAGRLRLGSFLALAGLAGLAPPTLGWPVLAAAWTCLGLVLVLEFSTSRPGRLRHVG
jgi:hypothetical protein